MDKDSTFDAIKESKKIKKIELAQGAFICKMQDFIQLYPKIAETYFTNKSCDDIVLFVPENVRISKMINLRENLESCFGGTLSNNVVIFLDKYSYLKIYDKIVVDSLKSLNVVCSVECFVQKGAQLTFLHDSQLNCNATETTALSFYLEECSRLECFFALVQGKVVEKHIEVFLIGEHSLANVNGFYVSDNDQKFYLHTVQQHVAKNSCSKLIINGVASGSSYINYKGKAFIDRNCKGVEVLQENKNFLLGGNAIVDSSPTIEALENDITCKHGSAVGYIDQEKLFYLKSRGLSEKQALMLLVEGFFDFFVTALDDPNVKEIFLNRMREKVRQIV